ncbi:MAG: transcriptional regulator PpsR [Alphaproteobacteria bacterium]|nr:transcriptional regulator PpsR [Alphaproteobacteria bacterium]
MKPFTNPNDTIGNLDAAGAARLIQYAADIALIIDQRGVIRDLALGLDDLPGDLGDGWIGRALKDVVSAESRDKVFRLLDDATGGAKGRGRHLNHPLGPGAADLPVLYVAVPLGADSWIVALGRDLRPLAQLQQRLVDAQQSLEQDYSRLRHVETRYRLLFQIASDPILVVDAATQRVLEANPAAVQQLPSHETGLVGRRFPEGFTREGAGAVDTMLAGVRTSGRPDEIPADTLDGESFVVSASLFRQEATALFLIRLAPSSAHQPPVSPLDTKSLRALSEAPDGFALTDDDGRILRTNPAFLELAQLHAAEQAEGETLDRWVGRSGVDLNVLLANLRERGMVKLFTTQMRGEHGVVSEVEISAVSVVNGGKPNFGFLIRNVGRRLQGAQPTPPAGAAAAGQPELPRSVEQLTELVGRVSLKDLVRETTDMIERLYIEAALELTGNNRASAAEMLGLSRQSLYVKLHRYGLRDLDGEESKGEAGKPESGK